MDNLHFSEDEIEEQLAALGYKNIPKHRLCQFKQDLDDLVRRGEWKSLASAPQMNPATSQPSPPAFTKEKVGHCYFQSSGEGFFLHARKVDHDRQVLTSCQSRDREQQQGRCDSYARHSVALNLRLPPGAPSRLQVEEEEEEPDETLHPPLTESYASTPDSHRGRFIKRKVLRKHKGETLVCDESVYSEDASCLEERLADLRLSSSAQRDFETAIEDVSGQSDTQSSETDGVSFGAFESYIRGMTRTQSDGDLRRKPKSFIRPAMSQQILKKTDPVAKYFEYKQHWAMHKVPGEDERRSERREIKERLAYRPPPPKPRRVYVPNTYVVPTEKKRSALCWRIRNDLANGLLPHKFSHEF
ncbi:centriolar and ciliogenesis-associated protein HYLS1 [Lycodopsis pacificus]